MSATAAFAEPDDPGESEYPTVVCTASDGEFSYEVTQTAEREFDVVFFDLVLQSAVGPDDLYVPIPEEWRFATHTIEFGPEVVVGPLTVSQGVEMEEGENFESVITGPVRDTPNPGEQANIIDQTVTWIQDTDVQQVDGELIEPGFPPVLDMAASAGVLETSLTIPDDVDGEVVLIDSAFGEWVSLVIEQSAGVWVRSDELLTVALEGCSVVLEALDDGGEDANGDEDTDGDTGSEGDVDTDGDADSEGDVGTDGDADSEGADDADGDTGSEGDVGTDGDAASEGSEDSAGDTDLDEMVPTGLAGAQQAGILAGIALLVGVGLLMLKRRNA